MTQAWTRFDVQAPPSDGWYELRWPLSQTIAIVLCRRVSVDKEQWQWSWSHKEWQAIPFDELDRGEIEWRPVSPEWLAHVAENLTDAET